MNNITSLLESHKIHFALGGEAHDASAEQQMLYVLLEEMANDSNSSKFREDVTKIMIGLRPSEGKHGYDDDFEAIEVKPQNFTGKTKLNGYGNFTDFTWSRHQKYTEDNVRMVVSGFNRGRLVYIVEFPYTNLESVVEEKLRKHLPNGDAPYRYVRGVSFGYKHWVDMPHVITYVTPALDDHKDVIVGNLYNHLKENSP